MGLSSSQARLLSLTSRQHDIEYKAQKLEAQKLQMANESDQVYSEYEDALNASKIQLKTVGSDGSSAYIDATYNNLVAAGYKLSSGSATLVSQADIDYFNSSAEGNGIEFACLKSGYCQKSSSNTVLTSDTSQICIFSADQLTAKAASSSGNKYVLMSDINLTSSVSNFAGTLDADNHTISGVTGALGSSATVKNANVSALTSFTAGETYHISTIDDLNQLAALTDGGVNTSGVTFVLDNNLDLSSVSNFARIGTDTTNSFKGSFDGNGHTISNLTVSSAGAAGLFGYTNGATIKNVGVTDANINSTGNWTGILVGCGANTTIDNSYTTGTVNSTGNFVGGLVGVTTSNSTVSNSYSTANIDSGVSRVGGLIGQIYATTVSNSYSTGNVNGSVYSASFIGYVNGGSVVNGYSTNTSGLTFINGSTGTNTYTNCVYASGSAGVATGSTQLTPAQMQDESTMAGYGYTEANGWSYSGGTPSATTGTSSSTKTSKYDPSTAPGYDNYLEIGKAISSGTYFLMDGHENDTTWFTNMLDAGFVILSKKDPSTGNYFDTNVATDTNLQEVSDEKNLKKAEAKYESSMAKIDAKDKKFDTDIASLDTERNAIKTEIDTLKTVAKDNVDRTFKLFS